MYLSSKNNLLDNLNSILLLQTLLRFLSNKLSESATIAVLKKIHFTEFVTDTAITFNDICVVALLQNIFFSLQNFQCLLKFLWFIIFLALLLKFIQVDYFYTYFLLGFDMYRSMNISIFPFANIKIINSVLINENVIFVVLPYYFRNIVTMTKNQGFPFCPLLHL